jgi:BirA family biotin operon repressor/biotin-[acetyl-CoA-carboxylase] ligase
MRTTGAATIDRSAIESIDSGLSVDAIRRELSGTTVGQLLYVYGTLDSANARLARLAAAGAPDGTVVLADAQTAACGRRGAPWFSPPGVNLYASVLFRRSFTVKEVPVFSFITALAVVDAVDELGLHAVIKWPNDVLVGRKKVAGARGECAMRGDVADHVILGVGVNVNVTSFALAQALGSAGQLATSLAELTGEPIDRNAFAGTYLRALDEWAALHDARGPDSVLAAWRDREILGGRRVEVRDADGSYEGRVLGVGADGHLIVREPYGDYHDVPSGEVRLAE